MTNDPNEHMRVFIDDDETLEMFSTGEPPYQRTYCPVVIYRNDGERYEALQEAKKYLRWLIFQADQQEG